jgi:hypothetical protein
MWDVTTLKSGLQIGGAPATQNFLHSLSLPHRLDLKMLTFEDILWELVMTLFALLRSGNAHVAELRCSRT